VTDIYYVDRGAAARAPLQFFPVKIQTSNRHTASKTPKPEI
jgi:hypothetical protein